MIMEWQIMTNMFSDLRYMVVDCGGGTVDITVHELNDNCGTLRELHKATGGPWGSVGMCTKKLFIYLFSCLFI